MFWDLVLNIWILNITDSEQTLGSLQDPYNPSINPVKPYQPLEDPHESISKGGLVFLIILYLKAILITPNFVQWNNTRWMNNESVNVEI